jgi:hypothetical protein
MTADKTYNGWTNYETWNVALWIGNEQNSSEYWAEQAQECWDNADGREGVLTREERAKYDLADRLKSEFEEGKEEVLKAAKATASVWGDLLGAALSEVNWDEIAGNYIDDVDKEDESDKDEDE